MRARMIFDEWTSGKAMKYALLALCMWLLCGCERREVTHENEYTVAEITVTADWSGANLDYENKYGSTLVFYPHDGGSYRQVLMGDRKGEKVRLSVGTYDVLLFNRSFNDFGNVAFRGHEALETFEVYSTKRETRAEGAYEVIVASPERIAAAVYRDFEVTEDMIGNYTRDAGNVRSAPVLLPLTPLEVTRSLQVKVHIRGVSNVRSVKCTISGMPSSLFLSSGALGEEYITQEFALGNMELSSGSRTDGYVSNTITVFGFDGKRDHQVAIEALLVDGTTVVEQTLTGVTVTEKDNNGIIGIYIEGSAPDVMPDVKPEGSSESGFDASVDGWGEEQEEDILM